MTAARIVAFVLLAVALAVTANLVLLGIATGPQDPVGRLTPRAGLVLLPSPPPATLPSPPPATTVPATPGHPRDGERRGSSQDD